MPNTAYFHIGKHLQISVRSFLFLYQRSRAGTWDFLNENHMLDHRTALSLHPSKCTNVPLQCAQCSLLCLGFSVLGQTTGSKYSPELADRSGCAVDRLSSQDALLLSGGAAESCSLSWLQRLHHRFAPHIVQWAALVKLTEFSVLGRMINAEETAKTWGKDESCQLEEIAGLKAAVEGGQSSSLCCDPVPYGFLLSCRGLPTQPKS